MNRSKTCPFELFGKVNFSLAIFVSFGQGDHVRTHRSPQRHGHVRGNAAFMLEAVKLQEKSLGGVEIWSDA